MPLWRNLVNSADLKSAGFGLPGSSPGSGTKLGYLIGIQTVLLIGSLNSYGIREKVCEPLEWNENA
jgi:hypothetical protein